MPILFNLAVFICIRFCWTSFLPSGFHLLQLGFHVIILNICLHGNTTLHGAPANCSGAGVDILAGIKVRRQKASAWHAYGILIWNPKHLKRTADRHPKNKVNSHWRRLDLIVRLSRHRSTIHPAGSLLTSMTQSIPACITGCNVLLSLSLRHSQDEVCVWKLLSCLSLSLLRTDSRVRSWHCSLNASEKLITSHPTTTSARPYRREVVFSCLFCQQSASHSHSL